MTHKKILGMKETEAKSFKKDGDYIYIYGDNEGADLMIALPVWMFNQMVMTFFGVEIAHERGEG